LEVAPTLRLQAVRTGMKRYILLLLRDDVTQEVSAHTSVSSGSFADDLFRYTSPSLKGFSTAFPFRLAPLSRQPRRDNGGLIHVLNGRQNVPWERPLIHNSHGPHPTSNTKRHFGENQQAPHAGMAASPEHRIYPPHLDVQIRLRRVRQGTLH